MTYKFPQFKVEISNPTLSVDLDTIQDKAISKLLSVSIVLNTDTASFGLDALDMPYLDTWEDNEVKGMVVEWLEKFAILAEN
jgi:hypothetical protein